MKRLFVPIFLCFVAQFSLFSQSPAPSGLLCQLLSHPELSVITSSAPSFGWVVNSDKPGDFQKAYQIMVASSVDLLKKRNGRYMELRKDRLEAIYQHKICG